MRKIIFIGVILVFAFSAFCQDEIEYRHRSVFKGLKKVAQIENPVFNEIQIPDSMGNQRYFQGKFFSVSDKTNLGKVYLYIGRVNTCRAGGCSAPLQPSESSGPEYFDYFIIFDSIYTVLSIKIFNYQATHGQGVTARGWLKQFVGFNGSYKLESGKDIDSISGATISVLGIISDVQQKTEMLKQVIHE